MGEPTPDNNRAILLTIIRELIRQEVIGGDLTMLYPAEILAINTAMNAYCDELGQNPPQMPSNELLLDIYKEVVENSTRS